MRGPDRSLGSGTSQLRRRNRDPVKPPWRRRVFIPDSRPLQDILSGASLDERRAAARWCSALSRDGLERFRGGARTLLVGAFHAAYQPAAHARWEGVIDETLALAFSRFSLILGLLNSPASFDELMETIADAMHSESFGLGRHPILTSKTLNRAGEQIVLAYVFTIIAAAVCFAHRSRGGATASLTCRVCMDAPTDAALSCGHMVSCMACAERLSDESGWLSCPVCKARVRIANTRKK